MLGDEQLYSEEEAAALLRMTPRMLADRRRAGRIGCIKDGRAISYTDKHIAEYRRWHEQGSVFSNDPSDSSKVLEVVKNHLTRIQGGKVSPPLRKPRQR